MADRSRRGTLPDAYRRELESEGIAHLEENVRGHITYRHYRAPRERSNWKRRWVRAAVVVTGSRLGVFIGGGPFVNVGFDDQRLRRAEFAADGRALTMAVDSADYNEATSGRIELRLKVAQPALLLDQIRSRIA